MPSMFVNGVNLVYEEMGTGTPLALTPGGMFGMEAVRPLAERMASRYRVIIYDPRGRGASDLSFGEGSEVENRADDLYELLTRLEATPAYVGGPSLGCTVSLRKAILHPEAVKGLLLWHAAISKLPAEVLYGSFGQYIEMALRDGMKGVIESEFYSQRIEQNPSNRERLMSMDPQEFIEVMRRRMARVAADNPNPVLGCTEEELRAIETPAVVVPGSDEIHPRAVGEDLHRLLSGSELHPPVFSTQELELLQQDRQRFVEQVAERMSAVFLPFLARLELAQASAT